MNRQLFFTLAFEYKMHLLGLASEAAPLTVDVFNTPRRVKLTSEGADLSDFEIDPAQVLHNHLCGIVCHPAAAIHHQRCA